jgi:TfoX/Sxy family transcriptional regulator of competence genes
MAIDPETAERVRRYMAARDDVVEKRMVGGLSFMVNGRMCCGVTGTGLMIRLGREGAASALEEAHVRPLVLGGKTVDAFVVVDPEGFDDDAALAAWIERGLAFLAEGD